ncbi:hypothetical protein [Bradyrhizobium sp. CCBAU 11386]|uniref:hypothetical protein n=1 Tax=Bradyrhizobium sp. CCBAU 11386 TaxID=1630837 RepID=UPI002FE24FAF
MRNLPDAGAELVDPHEAVDRGVGREQPAGAYMWGFERHGIVPDLVTLASRWEMDFQLALSSAAERRWSNLVPPLATQTHSLEIQSE